MNAKAIIYEYLDDLKAEALDDKDLIADYGFLGSIDYNMTNPSGNSCSSVSSGWATIYFFLDQKEFLYRGDTAYGDFGKAEFKLNEALTSLLPVTLIEALLLSAEKKTSVRFLLPPNFLDLN